MSNKGGDVNKEAIAVLLSPDGYYTYLQIQPIGAVDDKEKVDKFKAQVKKSYRKLCLRHHPDKPGGSADTFQALNRAYKVLSNPVLRKQYDMIGLDLDDDCEQNERDEEVSDKKNDEKSSEESSSDPSTEEDAHYFSAKNSPVSQIASAVIAFLMTMAVRTIIWGSLTLVLSRYRIFLYPILLLVFGTCLYAVFSIIRASNRVTKLQESRGRLLLSLLGVGLYVMHRAGHEEWTIKFWMGESLVLLLLMINYSSDEVDERPLAMFIVSAILAPILTYIIGARFWRYSMIIGIELVIGLCALVIFPILEVMIEQIVNEKLQKVGEKVRAHVKRMEEMKK